MAEPVASLAELQRQFFDRVVGERPADGLLASGDADIYAQMYTIRLHDVLAEDYPKLRAALGDERFRGVALHYLRAHPPRSFTLRDAGLALPAFLAGSEHAPAWAAELAALERARVEVFDGPDARPLAQDDVAALGDRLPALRLSWVPSSVIVPLAWAVDDLWSAIEDGLPGFEPAPASRVVLAWRRDIAVLHRTLDEDEAQLAPQLARGASFAEVCEVLGEVHGDAASQRAVELLLRWLQAGALDSPPPAALDSPPGP
jgi:putative DNA-binding protein